MPTRQELAEMEADARIELRLAEGRDLPALARRAGFDREDE